ncbi:MAG: rod shape-determining protein MreC [Sedimentisphaerales bacterium]|nr:rod shape-determining protein MreC [Sedimentisphaerales bacterium]
MARKQFKVSSGMLFTWLLLSGFILLFVPKSLTNKIQFTFARTFRLPLGIGRNVLLSARMEKPVKEMVSRRQYRQLQNYLAAVEEELIRKNMKIEQLSGLRERLFSLEDANLMFADIISRAIERSRCQFIINRGRGDGIAKGQFVLGDNSIIGVVDQVDRNMAEVKLITDPGSKIAVKIAQTKALMQGYGGNIAKVRTLLQEKNKIKAGENVLAYKKPGFLDSPFIIGMVQSCQRDDENPLLWDITVKPACDIERLERVTVIVISPKN